MPRRNRNAGSHHPRTAIPREGYNTDREQKRLRRLLRKLRKVMESAVR